MLFDAEKLLVQRVEPPMYDLEPGIHLEIHQLEPGLDLRVQHQEEATNQCGEARPYQAKHCAKHSVGRNPL